MGIVLLDTEFLVSPGAPQRFWNGPRDPDPLVAEIGAVRLSDDAPFGEVDHLRVVVAPVDRYGDPVPPDALFTRLTGLTAEDVAAGVSLAAALDQLSDFAGNDLIWSWGKDELNLVGVSCAMAGIVSPVPPRQFANFCTLTLRAGMPYDDLIALRSPGLPGYYGLPDDDLTAHSALGDARALARVATHLLADGRLEVEDFARARGETA
ncbi:exonuclease [Pseudaestuariivita sp.]|uniref:exonuclease n=1 Tax=Pseudaestuariivita sp. TaxID=2211669 RepID=UPI0040591DE9